MTLYSTSILKNWISVEIADQSEYKRTLLLAALVIALGFLVLIILEIPTGQRLTTAAVIFVAYPVIVKRGNTGLQFSFRAKAISKESAKTRSAWVDIAAVLHAAFFLGVAWLFLISILELT